MNAITPLPDGGVLLHIGLPKTGTTAIQYAASRRRVRLRDLGVCYPGAGLNHSAAARALMGLEQRGKRFPISIWDDLVRELHDSGTRVGFISQELIADATGDVPRAFIEGLQAPVHVVITLRGFQQWLPSIWQQYVKAGFRQPLDRWLDAALPDEPEQIADPPFLYQWPTTVVRRWLAVADGVTVVILDREHPQRLYDAFEGMLGLPEGLLAGRAPSGYRENRGLSEPEMQLLLALNDRWDEHREELGSTYFELVRMGVVAGLQEQRRPAPGERRTLMPRSAAARLATYAEREAHALHDLGVPVIGDLAALRSPGPTSEPSAPLETVPLDLATAALVGMMSAASHRGVAYTRKAPTPTGKSPLEEPR